MRLMGQMLSNVNYFFYSDHFQAQRNIRSLQKISNCAKLRFGGEGGDLAGDKKKSRLHPIANCRNWFPDSSEKKKKRNSVNYKNIIKKKLKNTFSFAC